MKRAALDDPRWRPLADVYQMRHRQIGTPALAARDITDALLQGVRCMARKVNLRLPGPDRGLVPAEFWKDHELYVSREEVLITGRGEGVRLIMPLKGYAYFLWGPDADKAWPSSTEAEPEAGDAEVGRPPKLTADEEKEIVRRLKRNETGIPTVMFDRDQKRMHLRSWQRHVANLRKRLRTKTTK